MGTEAVFVNLSGVDFGDLARLHLLVKLAHDQVYTLDFSALDHFRVRNYWLRLRVLLLKFEPWIKNLFLALDLVNATSGGVFPRLFPEETLILLRLG